MKVRFRKGDTFWYYSQLFNVPLILILESNPHVSPNAAWPGTVVDIPGYVTESYIIQENESLWVIARRSGLSVDALVLLNADLNPMVLQPGQIIRLPGRITWLITQTNRAYDSNSLITDINRLLAIYPFIKQRSIGTSVMGKEITELRIGIGKKRVHVNGSFHANEWITTPVLMRFLNEYLLALTNKGSIRGLQIERFFNSVMLSIVPMVNPDGVDLVIHGAPYEEPYRSWVISINQGNPDFSLWKANIRGVDLNNQFPALWEREAATKEQSPSPRDYPGSAPLTESEAIAMANLTKQSDFHRVLAFHTQGKVIFWGFENLEPQDSRRLADEFARVSGYTPIAYTKSYAGYKDWFIQEWRRPGFTIELGRGMNPLPLSQFEEIYQESLGILLASIYA